MFTSQQFGVINMILGASLRCVRVSHYDTQKIAYNMAPLIARDYEVVRNLDFEDMRAFVPAWTSWRHFMRKATCACS